MGINEIYTLCRFTFDSKMDTNLDKERAKERKGEILHTFERMIMYAVQNDISSILIAGDMFDVKNISATARNVVLYNIVGHPEITFYYLRGNHDNDNFLSGMELSRENAESAYTSLVLDSKKFNIVMLHGQESKSDVKDRAEIINLKALRNKGIDYLALGHIHIHKMEKLDARGTYCYAGCLEGRGFDECGEHGFVVLDIDEDTGTYTCEFVPFAPRKLYTVNVDVTDCGTTAEMISKAALDIQNVGCDDEALVKIVLKGLLDVECEKDIVYFQSRFRQRFYYVKVYDETRLKIDIGDYMLDESLKGEYVRQVMEDQSIPEEDKKIIIRYGLQAIAGEEVQ
ncbi:metallophosphoesterase family protein [Roseburia sp. 1XD42-69]|uniref:metallophosphoesterase family protein n=1 Tax=Roseburia sp. 1XD42-69 TaxID=2320088 RepID=UPI001FAAAAFD|nr:metallophosphoesterase family protein [Roseburia sp. 1XD42-69]